jgi:hypothetical protein
MSGEKPYNPLARRCDTARNQIVASKGAIPSRRPGRATSSSHAPISFGRLISASSVPASASSERPLVLEASSSASPARGSRIGVVFGSTV